MQKGGCEFRVKMLFRKSKNYVAILFFYLYVFCCSYSCHSDLHECKSEFPIPFFLFKISPSANKSILSERDKQKRTDIKD